MIEAKRFWSKSGGTDATRLRQFMSNVSILVRRKQYRLFFHLLEPLPSDRILDVGVSPDLRLKDTNFFLKQYSYKKRVTIASVEDCTHLVTLYGLAGFTALSAGKPLPFPDRHFDIVVSWATLEHVGNNKKQAFFLRELLRVGKKVFVTTPDRLSPYEPHTVTFFLHWLPKQIFRSFLKRLGKDFWAKENNLNILSYADVLTMIKAPSVSICRFLLFGLPSHIIIYRKGSR